MRQSELAARLSRLAESVFRDARRVLALGVELTLGGRSVTQLEEPAQTLTSAARYDAVLWRLSSDTSQVRAGLAVLRGALSPGAVVLLAAPRRAPAMSQLRSVLAGESSPRARLEPLCDALLLSGLLGPRVHQGLPGWLLVTAELARSVDPLDAFFEQLPGAQSR
jgi:hypothetical protein